jgi:hypothetical protein
MRSCCWRELRWGALARLRLEVTCAKLVSGTWILTRCMLADRQFGLA